MRTGAEAACPVVAPGCQGGPGSECPAGSSGVIIASLVGPGQGLLSPTMSSSHCPTHVHPMHSTRGPYLRRHLHNPPQPLTSSLEWFRVLSNSCMPDRLCRSSTAGAHRNRMVNVRSRAGSCSTWLKPMWSRTSCQVRGRGQGSHVGWAPFTAPACRERVHMWEQTQYQPPHDSYS